MLMRALGTLDPIIYFENSQGEIVLPPTTPEARYFYEGRPDATGRTYRDHGFEWREAGTLAEVDKLQARLVEQERRANEQASARDDARSQEIWAKVGSSLRARMVSSSTSEYEKEFIRLYLELREERREKHRQRWLERVSYLWAREMDSGAKATDRIRV